MREMAEARQALRLVPCEESDGGSNSQEGPERRKGEGCVPDRGGGEGVEKTQGAFDSGWPERMI